MHALAQPLSHRSKEAPPKLLSHVVWLTQPPWIGEVRLRLHERSLSMPEAMLSLTMFS